MCMVSKSRKMITTEPSERPTEQPAEPLTEPPAKPLAERHTAQHRALPP